MMGGHDIPGVGFAAGIERLLALMEAAHGAKEAPRPRSVAVVPVDEAQERAALLLAQDLRREGVACELITRGNMGKKMKRAEKSGAAFVAILGETELQSGTVVLKTLADGKQENIARSGLSNYLKNL
jgi:histidyl-tRNA synthetase